MSDPLELDRERVKAFLDDLARLSLVHGLTLEDVEGLDICAATADFDGYTADPLCAGATSWTLTPFRQDPAQNSLAVVSRNILCMSAHERLTLERDRKRTLPD